MWPTALPYVMTGVRLAATVALVLAITAELVIGSPGLGNQIAVAQTSGAVPRVYALVLVTGVLGVAVNLVARDQVDVFSRALAAGYEDETGFPPEIYICSASKGAELI